jgi:hypothetical protein
MKSNYPDRFYYLQQHWEQLKHEMPHMSSRHLGRVLLANFSFALSHDETELELPKNYLHAIAHNDYRNQMKLFELDGLHSNGSFRPGKCKKYSLSFSEELQALIRIEHETPLYAAPRFDIEGKLYDLESYRRIILTDYKQNPSNEPIIRVLHRNSPDLYEKVLQRLPEARSYIQHKVKHSDHWYFHAALSRYEKDWLPYWFRRSERVFCRGGGVQTLPRELKKILFSHCYEVDLISSQLSIITSVLDVPEVRAVLTSGVSVWDYLYGQLNTTADIKPQLKQAIYALVFGGRKHNAVRDLPEDIKKDFLSIPFIAELIVERDKYLKALKDQGMSGKDARSALANKIQGIEREIIEVLYHLQEKHATGQHPFQILIHSHDGFTFQANRNSIDVVKTMMRLRIERKLKELNIPGGLTFEYNGDLT